VRPGNCSATRGDRPAQQGRQEAGRPKGPPLTPWCFFLDMVAYTKSEGFVNLAGHPTVRRFHESNDHRPGPAAPSPLDAAWLRRLCLDCGADDAGLGEIGRRWTTSATTSCISFPHQGFSQAAAGLRQVLSAVRPVRDGKFDPERRGTM